MQFHDCTLVQLILLSLHVCDVWIFYLIYIIWWLCLGSSNEQKEPTPFIIEWIPDILPKSRIGELRIKFEYGHQRNGQIVEARSIVTHEIPIQTIQLQEAL